MNQEALDFFLNSFTEESALGIQVMKIEEAINVFTTSSFKIIGDSLIVTEPGEDIRKIIEISKIILIEEI